MHIAIIGAGISGLLTALELVEQGCQISIFDQQQSGQAASWAGGGISRRCIRGVILKPLIHWRNMAKACIKHGMKNYCR
jgi:glycine/D-amino acid oxidase-like deaminating enzyme